MGTGGFLRLDPAFAYAEASFLMTFVVGRVPHAGSRRDFILLDSKITADSDYSQEIKRHLLLGRKAMTKTQTVY